MRNPEVVTQRSLAGAPIEKPAGAKNSVFDNGVKRKGWPQALPPLDLSTLVIKKDVPLPPRLTANEGRNKALADMTKPGDSWEMGERYAKSFKAYCNKKKIPLELRVLGNDMVGVWRV